MIYNYIFNKKRRLGDLIFSGMEKITEINKKIAERRRKIYILGLPENDWELSTLFSQKSSIIEIVTNCKEELHKIGFM